MIVCGYCKRKFDTDKGHNGHKCKVLGFKPSDPRIMGKNWKRIQAKALERGEKSKK